MIENQSLIFLIKDVCEIKFCQFIEKAYFCTRKPIARFTERKRIFALFLYGETWTLSQMKIRNNGKMDALFGLYLYYSIHPMWGDSPKPYFDFQGVQAHHRK